MAKLSMSELTTYRWSFEEDVQHYCGAGIEGISVWRHKLSDFGDEKGVELLNESGLAVASLLWAGGFTGSDGRSHRESIQDALEAVRLAGNMNAGCLIVYSGTRAGHTHNHARRLLLSALKELLPVAAEQQVTLAIEPMHGDCAAEWTFLTDVEETMGIIESFDSPNLKLAFDTYHFGQDPWSMERLGQLTSKIAVVQLGDARQPPDGEQNRCRLGQGTIPLGAIVCALIEAGYDGYFDVELMGEEIEASDYQQLLAQSKQTFAELVPPQ